MNDKEKQAKIEKDERKAFITSLIRDIVGKEITPLPSEMEEGEIHLGYKKRSCPHNICDGSGYIKMVKEGRTYTSWCDCYQEEMMSKRLVNSKIEHKFWNADLGTMNTDKSNVTVLVPKMKPEPLKIDGRTKKLKVETPDEYIDRNYTRKEVKKGVSFYGSEYSRVSLNYLSQTPREKVRHLLLIGEPGCGKTHLACAVGKEFLKQGKKVYYTRLRTLLDNAFENKAHIRNVTETVDLLIIDELGFEYHTDSQYALKQIHELFKIRDDKNLPIICTTNFYPHEFIDFYGKSLASMFNGEFILSFMQSEYDLRLEKANNQINDFGFFNEE